MTFSNRLNKMAEHRFRRDQGWHDLDHGSEGTQENPVGTQAVANLNRTLSALGQEDEKFFRSDGGDP